MKGQSQSLLHEAHFLPAGLFWKPVKGNSSASTRTFEKSLDGFMPEVVVVILHTSLQRLEIGVITLPGRRERVCETCSGHWQQLNVQRKVSLSSPILRSPAVGSPPQALSLLYLKPSSPCHHSVVLLPALHGTQIPLCNPKTGREGSQRESSAGAETLEVGGMLPFLSVHLGQSESSTPLPDGKIPGNAGRGFPPGVNVFKDFAYFFMKYRELRVLVQSTSWKKWRNSGQQYPWNHWHKH